MLLNVLQTRIETSPASTESTGQDPIFFQPRNDFRTLFGSDLHRDPTVCSLTGMYPDEIVAACSKRHVTSVIRDPGLAIRGRSQTPSLHRLQPTIQAISFPK